MELSNQLPGSHPLTAPVHPPERVAGPPELHHSEGRCLCLLRELGYVLSLILTLAITWPQEVVNEEEKLAAAAQVYGGVR